MLATLKQRAEEFRQTAASRLNEAKTWLRIPIGPDVARGRGIRRVPRWMRQAAGLGGITLIIMAAVVLPRYLTTPAPAQPVPFSHRLHVTQKKLDCFFCHTSATTSSNAGMPAAAKCLLCHEVIAARFWPIRKLTGYVDMGKPVPWVRVNRLPEYVRFSHEAHLAKRIDCGRCHGNVAAMDRVGQVHRFDMNFCVTCHWSRGASDSCYVCHY